MLPTTYEISERWLRLGDLNNSLKNAEKLRLQAIYSLGPRFCTLVQSHKDVQNARTRHDYNPLLFLSHPLS